MCGVDTLAAIKSRHLDGFDMGQGADVTGKQQSCEHETCTLSRGPRHTARPHGSCCRSRRFCRVDVGTASAAAAIDHDVAHVACTLGLCMYMCVCRVAVVAKACWPTSATCCGSPSPRPPTGEALAKQIQEGSAHSRGLGLSWSMAGCSERLGLYEGWVGAQRETWAV